MLHCDCTAILDLCRAALSWVSQKNVLKIPITFCGIGFSITLVQWFHTLRIFFSLWIQRWSGCNFLYCVLFKRHKLKDTSCGLLCLWIDRWLCHGTPMDYLLGVCLWFCVHPGSVYPGGVLHVEKRLVYQVWEPLQLCHTPFFLTVRKKFLPFNPFLSHLWWCCTLFFPDYLFVYNRKSRVEIMPECVICTFIFSHCSFASNCKFHQTYKWTVMMARVEPTDRTHTFSEPVTLSIY